MKKRITVLMLTVIMLLLVGCGGTKSDAPVVGDWKLASVEAMGVSMTADEFAQATGSEVDMTLSIKDNGKFTANFQGESGTGKWTYEEPTLTLSDSDETMTGEYKDGKISLTLEEAGQSYTVTFEK